MKTPLGGVFVFLRYAGAKFAVLRARFAIDPTQFTTYDSRRHF
jgi:hypothetical protein